MRKSNGVFKPDVRDSKADWPAFFDQKAPEGAPNVLVILYDDMSFFLVRDFKYDPGKPVKQ